MKFYSCVKSLHDSKWAKIKTVVSDDIAWLNQSHAIQIWGKHRFDFKKSPCMLAKT